MFSPYDFHSAYFIVSAISNNLFSRYDFHTHEYDVELVVSPVEPPPEPLPKIALNEYKQFKAIRNGKTYYMSGKQP